ncbi:MAG: hypothetical protein B7Z67_00025 [Acidiphilium sp. 21-60-14]|nr:MAG: hypothetical protein B7Z67_00025 [Acidiphilium sp. 21-60-14]OZB40547.1 MAG: hypothetical protein B7X48_04040 [Acidiphilium sp. 34-60-192]
MVPELVRVAAPDKITPAPPAPPRPPCWALRPYAPPPPPPTIVPALMIDPPTRSTPAPPKLPFVSTSPGKEGGA